MAFWMQQKKWMFYGPTKQINVISLSGDNLFDQIPTDCKRKWRVIVKLSFDMIFRFVCQQDSSNCDKNPTRHCRDMAINKCHTSHHSSSHSENRKYKFYDQLYNNLKYKSQSILRALCLPTNQKKSTIKIREGITT